MLGGGRQRVAALHGHAGIVTRLHGNGDRGRGGMKGGRRERPRAVQRLDGRQRWARYGARPLRITQEHGERGRRAEGSHLPPVWGEKKQPNGLGHNRFLVDPTQPTAAHVSTLEERRGGIRNVQHSNARPDSLQGLCTVCVSNHLCLQPPGRRRRVSHINPNKRVRAAVLGGRRRYISSMLIGYPI